MLKVMVEAGRVDSYFGMSFVRTELPVVLAHIASPVARRCSKHHKRLPS